MRQNAPRQSQRSQSFSVEPLPPTVAELLANVDKFKACYPINRPDIWRVSRVQPARSLFSRVFMSSSPMPDTPTASFYRIYIFFVLNWTTAFRGELECFCRNHPDWAVADLLDPADPDPLRAARIAALTQIMCDAFNRRVELGLPRDAPAIIEDWDEVQSRPKVLEHPPEWATRTPPLAERFVLPDDKGELPDEESPHVSPHFKAMNILAWTPHFHFV